jgi:hypothetical protein
MVWSSVGGWVVKMMAEKTAVEEAGVSGDKSTQSLDIYERSSLARSTETRSAGDIPLEHPLQGAGSKKLVGRNLIDNSGHIRKQVATTICQHARYAGDIHLCLFVGKLDESNAGVFPGESREAVFDLMADVGLNVTQ